MHTPCKKKPPSPPPHRRHNEKHARAFWTFGPLRTGLLLPDGWTWNVPTTCTDACAPVPPTRPSSRSATCRSWCSPTTNNCPRTHGQCWPTARRRGFHATPRSLNVNATLNLSTVFFFPSFPPFSLSLSLSLALSRLFPSLLRDNLRTSLSAATDTADGVKY